MGTLVSMNTGTPFTEETHIVDLTEKTRSDNARFFENDINKVPTQAITMVLRTIMKAKKNSIGCYRC